MYYEIVYTILNCNAAVFEIVKTQPRKIQRFLLIAGAAWGVFLHCHAAFAATDQADLTVGIKTLPLLVDRITGTTTMAIIYDPANPASKSEADEIKSIVDKGLEAPGELKLVSKLVPVDELAALSGSKIAILTSGLSAHYDAIGKTASANAVLTMSTDLGCVQANKCILGIVSKPHVEIYYSKVAAEAAHINFGQVFALLVKQI